MNLLYKFKLIIQINVLDWDDVNICWLRYIFFFYVPRIKLWFVLFQMYHISGTAEIEQMFGDYWLSWIPIQFLVNVNFSIILIKITN